MPSARSAAVGEPGAPPLSTPSTATTEHPLNIAGTPIAPKVPVAPPPISENPVMPASEAPRAGATIGVAPPVSTPAPPASPAADTFAGPRVVHQATPAVPRGIGPMITTDVQIDVAVAIDASGKVT